MDICGRLQAKLGRADESRVIGLRGFLLAALLALAPAARTASEAPAELFQPAVEAVAGLRSLDGGLVRVRSERAAFASERLASGKVRLNLFADVRPVVSLEAMGASGAARAWRGAAGGDEVVLSLVEGRLSGSVRTVDGRFFQIVAVERGTSEIREVSYQRMFLGDDAVAADLPPASALEPEPAEQAGVATLDVLVAATPAAAAARGGLAGLRDLAHLAVAETNAGWARSGAALQLSLAGVEVVDLGPGEGASGGFLSAVTGHAGLQALRDQHGADLVSVWLHGPGANGGVIGLAWILQGQGAGFASRAYSVVEQNFAAGPGFGFAHEIGHNLGCAHDRYNSGCPVAFPFSHGYQDPQGGFHTMMAYANGCGACSGITCGPTRMSA